MSVFTTGLARTGDKHAATLKWCVMVVLVSVGLMACSGGQDAPSKDGSGTSQTTKDQAEDGISSANEEDSADQNSATQSREKLEASIEIPLDDPDYAGLPKARIYTSMGEITIALFPEQAPMSVENFISYVKGRQYTRTIFHRVIPGFMIQGGGFSTFLEQRRTGDPIAYEGDNGLANDRGTIAMARTNDPDSATAQWYINLEDNPSLNHGARGPNVPGYTVFGRVMSGMNVVDAIALVETSVQISGAGQTLANAPVDPVVIEKIDMLGSTD